MKSDRDNLNVSESIKEKLMMTLSGTVFMLIFPMLIYYKKSIKTELGQQGVVFFLSTHHVWVWYQHSEQNKSNHKMKMTCVILASLTLYLMGLKITWANFIIMAVKCLGNYPCPSALAPFFPVVHKHRLVWLVNDHSSWNRSIKYGIFWLG